MTWDPWLGLHPLCGQHTQTTGPHENALYGILEPQNSESATIRARAWGSAEVLRASIFCLQALHKHRKNALKSLLPTQLLGTGLQGVPLFSCQDREAHRTLFRDLGSRKLLASIRTPEP